MTVDQVPAWTAEDESNFKDRLERATAMPTGEAIMRLFAREVPATAVTLAIDLTIARRPKRARCPKCRLYRVLYAIEATGNAFGASEPRCATCWSIREGR